LWSNQSVFAVQTVFTSSAIHSVFAVQTIFAGSPRQAIFTDWSLETIFSVQTILTIQTVFACGSDRTDFTFGTSRAIQPIQTVFSGWTLNTSFTFRTLSTLQSARAAFALITFGSLQSGDTRGADQYEFAFEHDQDFAFVGFGQRQSCWGGHGDGFGLLCQGTGVRDEKQGGDEAGNSSVHVAP
jgi:hypothetical protein